MDDVLFETNFWKIILADDQYYLGRCYIPLKRKCGNLAELKEDEIIDFFSLLKKLENAIRNINATTS